MLLRGNIYAPVPSSLRLNFKSQTHPRNLTISCQASLDYPLSISDETLEKRGFILRRTAEGLNLEALNKIFVAVGFPRRDPEKIRVALEHTDSLVWIQERKSQNNAVAFARATGDGVFNAIIWDVVVDPSFQGLGLGKAVVERLMKDLVGKGITNISLYSEPRVLGFYRPLGFVADPDGIRGMVYSTKNKRKK